VVKRVPESEAASETEVVEAIQALSTAELAKLGRFARYRVFTVGPRAARGRTARDLLADAMTATLDDTRRWRKGTIEFTIHLIGAMRSISNHWCYERETTGPAPTREGEAGEITAQTVDVDARLDAEALAGRIEEFFKDDALALEIIDGLKAGMSRQEIREILTLSEQQYDTAMKRIRRGVDKLLSQGGTS